ncbi:hypothetical protein BOTBODRAFT_180861 [Botryobasidium botryosum FD-172 SS1]|uniref:D-isomer specific 2-hydroxyacid dehydrogenase NAD-binding domain-containing protein n=1 Tax=Botryobasidium botryosum (strain FD-172 SS1) TaxID=930990 RepID=A0A067LVT1_BOTB1|nr:hypothetical protein BOTBODRAFT_180861 [Botryobasidium botryosum FD-172 SS1]
MRINEERIVVLGDVRVIKTQMDALAKQYLVDFVPSTSRERTIVELQELATRRTYHAMIVLGPGGSIGQLDAEIFGPFIPTLEFVSGVGAGFDHVDIDYLTANNVVYANTPYAVADPTATTTAMLILQTVRAASQAEMAVRRGDWRKGLEFTPDTRGLVVGILGMGNIGKLLMHKLEAFGFRIVYHNRHRLPRSEEGRARYVSFEELIQASDIICPCTPLTHSTFHLISDREFAMMKDGVFIINTSRGPVINEKALCRALQSGKVLRAGLDVFEREPAIEPYLLASDRVSLLPHWGCTTKQCVIDTENEAFDNLMQWIETGTSNTPVSIRS